MSKVPKIFQSRFLIEVSVGATGITSFIVGAEGQILKFPTNKMVKIKSYYCFPIGVGFTGAGLNTGGVTEFQVLFSMLNVNGEDLQSSPSKIIGTGITTNIVDVDVNNFKTVFSVDQYNNGINLSDLDLLCFGLRILNVRANFDIASGGSAPLQIFRAAITILYEEVEP